MGCGPADSNKFLSACAASVASACRPSQSTRPRAGPWVCSARSRPKDSIWPVLHWRAKKCTPMSLSWCASSNTTVVTLGSNSATPEARTPRSAKNRWWLTTTTSAFMASWRAIWVWQLRIWGQPLPRQLSRVDVTSGMMGERSSNSGTSAISPKTVDRAQSSTRASRRKSAGPRFCVVWRAPCRRWVHK